MKAKVRGYVWFGCGIVTAVSNPSIFWICLGLFMIVVGAFMLGEE